VPRQVTIREGTERWPLDPRYDLHKHSSSTGFAWGEGGAEPALQLALALLADALRNDPRALDVHQDFNQRVVPLFPKRWTISRSRILRIEAQHKTMSQEVRTYSLALAPETDRQN
jgi:hypothetical protein